MPERHIDAAINHLDAAVEQVGRLVGEVERLQTSKRRLTVVLSVLFVIVVAGIAGGGLLLNTVSRLDDTRLDVCRSRNSSYVSGRNDLESTLMFLVSQSSNPERSLELFDRLRSDVWTPIEAFHSDCVDDDMLTVDDYGGIVPDGLPVSIPEED